MIENRKSARQSRRKENLTEEEKGEDTEENSYNRCLRRKSAQLVFYFPSSRPTDDSFGDRPRDVDCGFGRSLVGVFLLVFFLVHGSIKLSAVDSHFPDVKRDRVESSKS